MSKTHNALKQEKKRGKKLSLINCTKSEKEMGITLIALIITVVILIILAVISLNAVFGSDGIIESARRSEIMNDFSTFKEQINTFNAEKELASEDYSVESLTAGRTSLIYNTQGEDTAGNIQTVIPSMNDNYAEKFEIIKGELLLWASSELEYEIAVGMGIQVSPYIIVDGVLLSANVNLGLQTENGVVTLPERVEEIGEGAFSGVEGLKEIIIPGTVKVIQKNAFSYNTEIEKVTIEDGVLSIGTNAFANCSSLKEIIMPDSVISMGVEAFRRCTNLTTVQLSNNLTKLNDLVFENCTNLTTINMPSNLTNIGDNTFSYCYKLDNINIPVGVINIESTAFIECTSLYNLTIDEANTVYEVEDGIIYTKDNSTLIMLAPMAEEETVTVREGVKRLNTGSLSICTSMTTLNLPSSLEYITGQAFPIDTTTLETINISESNEYYKAENGYIYSKDGTELVYVVLTKTEININGEVETIKTGAIYRTTVTELIIPDNVRKIESQIIQTAPNLKKICIGKGTSNLSSEFKNWIYTSSDFEIIIDEENPYYKVEGNLILTKDGKEVVTYINNIQSQIVPEGVETLETSFYGMTNLTEVILPSTLKKIGLRCFRGCSNLKEITIPNSVETIDSTAFGACNNLEEVRIDKEQGSISGSPWSAPKGERSIIWLR